MVKWAGRPANSRSRDHAPPRRTWAHSGDRQSVAKFGGQSRCSPKVAEGRRRSPKVAEGRLGTRSANTVGEHGRTGRTRGRPLLFRAENKTVRRDHSSALCLLSTTIVYLVIMRVDIDAVRPYVYRLVHVAYLYCACLPVSRFSYLVSSCYKRPILRD